MKITKKQAINEHRKMWNWIADHVLIGEYKCINVMLMKERYIHEVFLKEHPNESEPLALCFCCQYTQQCRHDKRNVFDCECCPIQWPGGHCGKATSPYHKLYHEVESLDEFSDLAREIANLPENKNIKV